MLTHNNLSNLTVIVDFSNVDFIDYSSAHAIRVKHIEVDVVVFVDDGVVNFGIIVANDRVVNVVIVVVTTAGERTTGAKEGGG